jgi:hypothetical protein
MGADLADRVQNAANGRPNASNARPAQAAPQQRPRPQIRSRKPTGRVPWPLILIEGGEKSGKSYELAKLSTSDKVGPMYWIDLGEGAADEYGAMPGTRYEVIEHDGSWHSIMEQIEAVYYEAGLVAAAQQPPVVLGIDSITAEWDMLKDWASDRAKGSRNNQAKLSVDPYSEIDVTSNYWNDANNRHKRLMRMLMTFPGIVVITARGNVVAAFGDDGKPMKDGTKTYRVDGQKNLAYDATAWIRMSRESVPLLIGARSLHIGFKPGDAPPRPLPGFTLEKFIFDQLKCDPATAHVRDLATAPPTRTAIQIRDDVLVAPDMDRVRELYAEAKNAELLGTVITNDTGDDEQLHAFIVRQGTEKFPDQVKAAQPPQDAPASRPPEQQQVPA